MSTCTLTIVKIDALRLGSASRQPLASADETRATCWRMLQMEKYCPDTGAGISFVTGAIRMLIFVMDDRDALPDLLRKENKGVLRIGSDW